jgi:hypothetical protein
LAPPPPDATLVDPLFAACAVQEAPTPPPSATRFNADDVTLDDAPLLPKVMLLVLLLPSTLLLIIAAGMRALGLYKLINWMQRS